MKVELDFLKDLENSSLTGISFIHPENFSIRTDFTLSVIPYIQYSLEMYNVIQFSFSRDPIEDSAYYVGEVNILKHEDFGKKVLGELQFALKDAEGRTQGAKNQIAYHIHIEGDICLDVVCESYRFFKEIN